MIICQILPTNCASLNSANVFNNSEEENKHETIAIETSINGQIRGRLVLFLWRFEVNFGL